MKVLVTGGAGFLGRHFARAHIEEGDDVAIIDDLSAPQEIPLTDDIEDHLDVMDCLEFFAHDATRWDLAYHFAAPIGGRLKIEGDPLFNAHSLALDEAFFRWAVRHTTTAVYPSSSAVYGVAYQDATGARSLHEGLFHPDADSWPAPDQVYGLTKMVGEVLAWRSAGYGLNTLCIRPFSGYGEGQSFDYPVPSIARRALRKEDPLVIWGSGSQTRDFIHVKDLVRLTRMALPVKGYQALNLGSGTATTFREVAEICARLVGYTPEIVTDESKPTGVANRWADIGFMPGEPVIDLETGLSRVLVDIERRTA